MIYLYGLTEPGAPPDPGIIAGLDGVTGPVRTAPTSAGTLVYGPHDGTEIAPKRRTMRAHIRVLETLADAGGGTLLPMRFGMWATDVAEVDAALVRQAAEVADAFDTVRRRVEVGLRISFPRDAALRRTLAEDPALDAERARLASGASGHFENAEFGRRLGEALDRRRGRAQASIVSALKPAMAGYVLKAPSDDVEVLSVDALVPRDTVDTLAEAAQAAAVATDFAPGAEAIVRVIGPVPPYSFVRLTLDTQAAAA